MQKPQFKNTNITGIEKTASRLALGCDNQTSSLHAFTMFDHFYGSGGRIFDTAFIYNHGMGDTYLGDWINARKVAGFKNIQYWQTGERDDWQGTLVICGEK